MPVAQPLREHRVIGVGAVEPGGVQQRQKDQGCDADAEDIQGRKSGDTRQSARVVAKMSMGNTAAFDTSDSGAPIPPREPLNNYCH